MKNSFSILHSGNVRLIVNEIAANFEFENVLPANLVTDIDNAWNRALALSSGELFEGKFLNYNKHYVENNTIFLIGKFLPYRFFWAQKRGLISSDTFAPIAVSGIIEIFTEKETQIVFGIRGSSNLQYQGFYELIPSGGIDFSNKIGNYEYHNQIRKECTEELGLDEKLIKNIETVGVVFDVVDNVYDICCRILVDGNQISKTDFTHRTKEYENIRLVDKSEVFEFVNKLQNIVPVSIGILNLIKDQNII